MDETKAMSPELQKILGAIEEMETVIVGKHREMILLMTAMLSGAHVLIEDVPGTGKTSLAATMSRVMGMAFNRAQFTPDIMASDITGFNIYNRQKETFEFRSGLVMCNLLLADEINRASPKTQSALLEAMEEGRVTVDGETYPMPEPFMVIATQNPTGYVGTYPLPEAQLDRFAFKLNMGYPSNQEEIEILRARRGQNPMENVRQVLSAEDIVSAKAQVAQVKLEDSLYTYIVALISATRHHKSFSLGASPRASVALMRLAQAYAFLRGRDYVLPDDIAALYRIAVAHRVILTQEAKLNHVTVSAVLDEIFRSVEVPYLGKK
ncbi:MAG: MoxR family ATPase [Clostridia bacterium]|nr:MoxR family ATPase [Clostridia bacterium]